MATVDRNWINVQQIKAQFEQLKESYHQCKLSPSSFTLKPRLKEGKQTQHCNGQSGYFNDVLLENVFLKNVSVEGSNSVLKVQTLKPSSRTPESRRLTSHDAPSKGEAMNAARSANTTARKMNQNFSVDENSNKTFEKKQKIVESIVNEMLRKELLRRMNSKPKERQGSGIPRMFSFKSKSEDKPSKLNSILPKRTSHRNMDSLMKQSRMKCDSRPDDDTVIPYFRTDSKSEETLTRERLNEPNFLGDAAAKTSRSRTTPRNLHEKSRRHSDSVDLSFGKDSSEFSSRHSFLGRAKSQENYVDSNASPATADDSEPEPVSVQPPVRPPRRRPSTPRKKGKAPQPPPTHRSPCQDSKVSPNLSNDTPNTEIGKSFKDNFREHSKEVGCSSSMENGDSSQKRSRRNTNPEAPQPQLKDDPVIEPFHSLAPKKPPRTFAYDIYKTTKRLRAAQATEKTTRSSENVDDDGPDEARHLDVDSGLHSTSSKPHVKPAVPPKPSHISQKPRIHSTLSSSFCDVSSMGEKAHSPTMAGHFELSRTPPPPVEFEKGSSQVDFSWRHDFLSPQPASLGFISHRNVEGSFQQRSLSDETLNKGSKQNEPIYAVPCMRTNYSHGDNLHYMCSDIFPDLAKDEEDEKEKDTGLIAALKEFRLSFRKCPRGGRRH